MPKSEIVDSHFLCGLKPNLTQELIDVRFVSSVLSHVRLQPKLVQFVFAEYMKTNL
jgi:hypothetical protein